MVQESHERANGAPALMHSLHMLSAREQIGLLLRATHTLSARDKAEVIGTTGLRFITGRFLPLALHFLLKRILTGVVWWFLSIVAALLVLFLLAFIEQVNARAVTPVVVGTLSYLAGFFLFTLFAFFHDLYGFFRRTIGPEEREYLRQQVLVLEYRERVALLRTLGADISNKVPGESLRASILTGIALFFSAAALIACLLGVSSLLPGIGSFPWLLLVAGCIFLAGCFLPSRFPWNRDT